ncbi:MAG: N-(5-phosphoribosyl)anthranilate isomerase [Pseudomonadota bacterium]
MAQLGADAQGLVFYAKSPRYLADLTQARAIVEAAGPFVTSVGLFVNPSAQGVHQVLAQVPLHLLQFHGDEPNDFCAAFGRPFIKALRMQPGLDLHAEMQGYPCAQGFLLDTYKPGVPGGTGEVFDWSLAPKNSRKAWVLAGGLNPDNLQTALSQAAPYAVDVSGGVELAPGVKCHSKIHEFIQRARG